MNEVIVRPKKSNDWRSFFMQNIVLNLRKKW